MVRDERQRATILGVVAASFLTGIKLLAGILSNSLAVLAEAAHSALDLASAAAGFYAIRVSIRPADSEHHYGHGKADTLGGLFAALLLLVTCGWIMYEGIGRLLLGSVVLDITLLTFVVIVISVAVDAERTIVFRRIGKKTKSPTIQGESLHFASDITSSSAVLAGLFLITLGYQVIDAFLAMGIALYFAYTSVHLIVVRTGDLLDRAPTGLRAAIQEIADSVKGVESSGNIRVRRSGSHLFVDMTVNVDQRIPLVASHTIASKVENAVKRKFKEADVLVHVNPASHSGEIIDKIRTIALGQGASGVHGVDIESYGDELRANIHLEFSPSTRIQKAHGIASRIETEVRRSFPKIKEVVTHLEPEEQKEGALETKDKSLTDKIREIATSQKGLNSCHQIFAARVGKELHVSMHCTFDKNLTVNKVHEISSGLEEEIKRQVRGVTDVVIHSEPTSAHAIHNELREKNPQIADRTHVKKKKSVSS
jgi:cation diffusion facilitator family transporter